MKCALLLFLVALNGCAWRQPKCDAWDERQVVERDLTAPIKDAVCR
jgi:hypothetical protein